MYFEFQSLRSSFWDSVIGNPIRKSFFQRLCHRINSYSFWVRMCHFLSTMSHYEIKWTTTKKPKICLSAFHFLLKRAVMLHFNVQKHTCFLDFNMPTKNIFETKNLNMALGIIWCDIKELLLLFPGIIIAQWYCKNTHWCTLKYSWVK